MTIEKERKKGKWNKLKLVFAVFIHFNTKLYIAQVIAAPTTTAITNSKYLFRLCLFYQLICITSSSKQAKAFSNGNEN